MPKQVGIIRVVSGLAVLVFGLQIITTSATSAVTPSQPTSGITVSPAFITTQVGSAQRQATASVGVRNNFMVPITITAVLNGLDIRNNSLLPTNRSESALADVITFTPAEVIIPPQSSRNITVKVTDKTSLAPGGHFVSLLITQSSSVATNSSSQLSLKPAVSTTIYVIKEDGAIRSLKATEIKLRRNIFSLPSSADVTFFNDGNVASLPRGILTIKPGSRQAAFAQAIVNKESVPLYPKQTTILRSDFIGLTKPKLPGRIVARLDYRPDGQVDTKSLSVSVWYVPVSSLILLIFVAALAGLLIWPVSRQKMSRFLKRRQKSKKKPYVSPDLSKTQKILNIDKKINTQKRRRIDIK